MERNILIPISQLKYDLTFVCHSSDMFTVEKTKSFIKKFGQWQEVVVALIIDEYWVICGDEFIEARIDEKDFLVRCYLIGEMTRDEYLAARLFLTARQERLNYIDIAKAVHEHSHPEKLPNITTLTKDDVDKYKQLLTFDWDEFLKSPINPGQLKLFDDER